MTEEEAKNALFKLHLEYMKHPPKERLKLYEEYKEGEENPCTFEQFIKDTIDFAE